MCLKGNYAERGINGRHGFLSEYYVEKEKHIVKVPKELGDLAVLLEPTSIGDGRVYKIGRQPDSIPANGGVHQ